MTINDKIRDEKLQYGINSEVAKISALSSRKIDKHKYLIGGEILPPDQRRAIEKATFAYSILGKAFEKQLKTMADQVEKKPLEEHGKQLLNLAAKKIL